MAGENETVVRGQIRFWISLTWSLNRKQIEKKTHLLNSSNIQEPLPHFLSGNFAVKLGKRR